MAEVSVRWRRRVWRTLLASGVLAASALLTGCPPPTKPEWPVPGTVTEHMAVLADDRTGPVLLGFAEKPLEPGTVADGLRRALMRATEGRHASAALFPATERDTARLWLTEQIRRRSGAGEVRLVLMGHGTGGEQAAEMARWVIKDQPSAYIVLLATVDAVKGGAMSRSAGYATAMVDKANPISRTRLDLMAYAHAPRVDGRRLRKHVNYYQLENNVIHGGPMDGATVNHRLTGASGTITHENADQYALPFLMADLAQALRW